MTSAAMPTRKCKFTDELKKKYPCVRLGRDASEAECMSCRAGTYVSVANKGGSDLEAHVHSAKHNTAARGESSSSKVTDFFVSKTDTSVTAIHYPPPRPLTIKEIPLTIKEIPLTIKEIPLTIKVITPFMPVL